MTSQKNNIEGFLRLKEILQLLKISRSSWYRGVASGNYPTGKKMKGGRTRVWSVSSIRQLIKDIEAGNHG